MSILLVAKFVIFIYKVFQLLTKTYTANQLELTYILAKYL